MDALKILFVILALLIILPVLFIVVAAMGGAGLGTCVLFIALVAVACNKSSN